MEVGRRRGIGIKEERLAQKGASRGIWPGLLILTVFWISGAFAGEDGSVPLASRQSHGTAAKDGTVAAQLAKRADFKQEQASEDARNIADWVVHSGDNHQLPFVIVDKIDGKVFVFDKAGRLSGAAPALLGFARGDSAVPGIGERKLASILPEERTTPAGRFVASLGRNSIGTEILWVDYESAVSLHRVITSRPEERRQQRLDTPTPLDNRISYGCINVPVKFFDKVVRPTFARTIGLVYVLPEVLSSRKIFNSYVVEEPKQ